MVGPLVLWPALVVHVALPLTAARHLVGDGRLRFVGEDAPRIAEGIEWLLSVYGWASLVTTRSPWSPGPRGIRLRLPSPPVPPPTPGRAVLRLATGLPAALGQLVIGAAALLPWLAVVACVLVTGRLPARLWRVQARVLARSAVLLCRQGMIVGRPSPPGPSAP